MLLALIPHVMATALKDVIVHTTLENEISEVLELQKLYRSQGGDGFMLIDPSLHFDHQKLNADIDVETKTTRYKSSALVFISPTLLRECRHSQIISSDDKEISYLLAKLEKHAVKRDAPGCMLVVEMPLNVYQQINSTIPNQLLAITRDGTNVLSDHVKNHPESLLLDFTTPTTNVDELVVAINRVE